MFGKNKSFRIQKLKLATDQRLWPHCDVAKVVDHLVSFLKWRVDLHTVNLSFFFLPMETN